jgi:Sulfotransferase family
VHVLTLRADAAPSPKWRPVLQRIAAAPPPLVPGLRARHWRAERRIVRGRYLFDDRASLDAFARDPAAADPAVAWLVDHPASPQILTAGVQTIASTDVLDRPVFIVSAPRAGSTLLYETLSESNALWTIDGESHGLIEGVPTLHVANRGFESHRLTDADADPETIRTVRAGFVAELRDRCGRRYLDLPEARRPARVRFLEKTPENALRVPFLRTIFPDARFVLLHRDARQNVSSLLEAWRHDGFVSIPDLPGWPRRHWCFLLPDGWRALASAPMSDVAALQWRAANQHALDDLATMPREQWTSVDYVDLVTAFEPAVRRVCAFMEVEVDARLSAILARPPAPSSTTLTPPSPIKWRNNRDLRAASFNDLGLLGGRLRNLATPPAFTGPTPPPTVREPFSCFLDELDDAPLAGGQWIVNPSFRLQAGVTLPLSVLRRTRFRERFLPDHPLVWIEDATTRVLYPFWGRRGQLSVLRALEAGREPPPSLPPSLAARLQRAGVLMRDEPVAGGGAAGDALVEDARAALERDRHCTLPSLIHPAHVGALARYYRALVQSGAWKLGDDQVERRHGWHNEPTARFFQHQLTDLVSRVAGEPLKTTYSYSSAYCGGATLRAHLDRQQCDFTLSLLIDRSADSEVDSWPLWFQAPAGRTRVTLGLGDAVLFRGCELPHWRAAAPADQAQTMLLFHYVPAGFVGVLD